MKISDQIGLAVTNLSRRKGRTALTVVGVVVGICAVIVMISMGIAESHNNDEMLKNMGGLTKIEVYNYSRLRPKRTALRSKAANTTEYDSRPFTRAILLGGLFVWG